MQVAVARQLYVAKDKAEAAAALQRAAEYTRRTVDVSLAPGATAGSHVLSYAGTPGATEANALYDTADAICEKLHAHRRAGVDYVLLTMHGGKEQLRRVARDIMPAFAARPARQTAGSTSETSPA
jgi:alkanesulfonate monooxygenase SsuD/methylene tetrahydromethanopterin reductase-like flavin-dependent oxidoreductase (luciferase family)